MPHPTLRPSPRRDGFSLVELLVVVAIIVLLIGILIPAASSARNSARRAKATATLTSLKNAFFNFKTANDRMPGPFTQDELGLNANAGNSGIGLTAMENALLELSGGLIKEDDYDSGVNTHIQITLGNTTAYIDTALVGASDGPGYLTASETDLSPIEGQTWNPSTGNSDMPDLIDPWGNAYMLWARNDLAGEINPCADSGQRFAAISAPGNPNSARSWFYWNTNAGIFSSTSVGKLAKNQRADSLLGEDASDAQRISSMRAFLGHPSFPCETDNGLPAKSYGDFLVHSPGTDGVYLGRKNNITEVAYPPATGLTANKIFPEQTDDLWATGS